MQWGAQEKGTALISRAHLAGVGPPAEGGCAPAGREGPGSPSGSRQAPGPPWPQGLLPIPKGKWGGYFTHDSLKTLLLSRE